MRLGRITLIFLAIFSLCRAAWGQNATLEGTVHDSLGRPIPGAVVVLKSSDGRDLAKVTADSAGHFAFASLGAGTYALVASQKDFEPATAIVAAGPGGPPIDLVLGARTALDAAVVARKLDEARNNLAPETGTNAYTVGGDAVGDMPQGADTALNHVLLQMPGAAQDSYGQVHLRGEHANLQYRINDILLPEGIVGFGQVLDTRIADSIELLDGALPAQYGYRTAGVVDITTKSGAFQQGGIAEIYGGSRDTVQPSIEYGGSQGPLNFFASGGYLHDTLGVEGPTSASQPLHDRTDQGKGFGYFSYTANPFNRLSLIVGTSVGEFQVPDNPGQMPGFPTPAGAGVIPSAALDENQTEINHYAILALQGTSEDGDIGYQLAPYTRYSSLRFTPDVIGDLEYNGIASNVRDSDFAAGLQGDGSYYLNDQHTIRAGFVIQSERAVADNSSQVFPVIAAGPPVVYGTTPVTIVDNHSKIGNEYGVYLQDEWRLFPKLTINFGARYDVVNAYVDESQVSPRLGMVYRATDSTTFHAGYAKYFTPPPLELIAPTSVSKFVNTSGNQFDTTIEDPVRSERSNEFDAGVEQELPHGIKLGWDNYYKIARNLLDEGQFGAALVYTPFNYAQGRIYGTEVTASYSGKTVNAYLNFAASRALGKDPDSQQATFSGDPTELAFAQHSWIYLDHDQLYTASGGVSWQVAKDTKLLLDAIFGSGLRIGFANTAHEPLYTQFDAGLVQHLDVIDKTGLDLRLSVINLLNTPYALRDGTGIGVFAPQWGPRRGYFAGISRQF